VPDSPPRVLEHPSAAFPAGVPQRAASVTVEVVVDADGRALSAEPMPGTVADPRLVAEARRVALASRYAPAVRGGVPVQQRLRLKIEFAPP
jgi:outer membrane biosynthesis protein TonB